MFVRDLEIPDVKLITAVVHRDARGFFSETYFRPAYEKAGLDAVFVQDNHSGSAKVGTIRGLHYQTPPHAQGKLVRVLRGAILDVAVDIRAGSPTYGRHVSATLSAENWTQMWVPEGFAHGFCTLEPDTEVAYKVTAGYAPHNDGGLLWNDPALGIAWPVTDAAAILSDKDRTHPSLANLPPAFKWLSSKNGRG